MPINYICPKAQLERTCEMHNTTPGWKHIPHCTFLKSK